MKGIQYNNDGDISSSIKELKRALKFEPSNGYAMNWLAHVYDKSGKYEEAFNVLINTPNNIPKIDETWYNVAHSFLNAGDIDRAIECYRNCLDINPTHIDALINLGRAYHIEKDMLQEAHEVYEKAYSLNSKDYILLCNIGNLLCDLDKRKDAIRYYNDAIRLKSDDNGLFLNLGIAQFQEGLLDDAEESFKNAISLNESDSRPYYNLGKLYQRRGLIKDAIVHLEKASSIGNKKAKVELETLKGSKS